MPALRTVATLAAAAALTVAAPVAANAAPYAPVTPASWTGAACAGGTFSHTLPSGTFDASRTLLESVSGDGGATPAQATFLASQVSYTLTSTASGAATVKLTFPSSASGSYNVSLAQQGGGPVTYGAVTINTPGAGQCATVPTDPKDPADPASAPDPAAKATSALALTGTDIHEGIVWGAGAAVVIGAIVTVIAARRRQPRRR